MDRTQFHVAVGRTGQPSQALVKQVSEVIGLTAYDVRLRLIGELPRPIVRYGSHAEARGIAGRLADLGLASVVYEESALPPVMPLMARRWERGATEMSATDRRGRCETIRDDEVALLVFGRKVVVTKEKQYETRVRVHTLHGAVTTSMEVKETKRSDRPLFAMVLPRGLDRAAIVFEANELDYECLRGKRQPSDAGNMQVLMKRLEADYAGAAVDRRMMEHGGERADPVFYNRKMGVDSTVAMGYLVLYERWAEAGGQHLFDAVLARGRRAEPEGGRG